MRFIGSIGLCLVLAGGTARGQYFQTDFPAGELNVTHFIPMELDDMERLVPAKGVVQKVPPVPASSIRQRCGHCLPASGNLAAG